MAPKYDLLVIDLDGTLLGPDGSVSPANIAAVAEAAAAGLEIVLATGRALVESLSAIEAIDHQGLVITAGGSMLSELTTGRTLHRHFMPHDLVRQVSRALVHHGHKALLLKDASVTGYEYLAVGPGALDPASQWWFRTLPVRVRFVQGIWEDPHPHETLRAGAVASFSELAQLATWLREEIGDRGVIQHWSAVTESASCGGSTHLLEVFNPEVDKWTMVTHCCRRDGIEPERVAAIGDGLNDVQLVGQAGLGVAMGNADPRVLAVADRVTGDHTSDGVAMAIHSILDGRW